VQLQVKGHPKIIWKPFWVLYYMDPNQS